MITCTGVSFAHGSNDGQKGMGLIMLILIGIVPGVYAINLTVTTAGVADARRRESDRPADSRCQGRLGCRDYRTRCGNGAFRFLKYGAKAAQTTFVALADENRAIAQIVGTAPTFDELTDDQRKDLRTKMLPCVGESIGKLTKPTRRSRLPASQRRSATTKKSSTGMTKFIPVWVKFAVASRLGSER